MSPYCLLFFGLLDITITKLYAQNVGIGTNTGDAAGEYEYFMGRCVALRGFNCLVGSANADAQKGKILLLNIE